MKFVSFQQDELIEKARIKMKLTVWVLLLRNQSWVSLLG